MNREGGSNEESNPATDPGDPGINSWGGFNDQRSIQTISGQIMTHGGSAGSRNNNGRAQPPATISIRGLESGPRLTPNSLSAKTRPLSAIVDRLDVEIEQEFDEEDDYVDNTEIVSVVPPSPMSPSVMSASSTISPTSTLQNAGMKGKTFLRAFTPMRSRVASQTTLNASQASQMTTSNNNRKNSNTLSPSSARTSLQAQQQKRPSFSTSGLPLMTMDSGIIPVNSRNGSPAGSSGLLGIPRENSVSGVDLTCDGGSILNGPLSGTMEPRGAPNASSTTKPIKARVKEWFFKVFRKFVCGIVIMVLVAGAWMSATQFIKSTYLQTSPTFAGTSTTTTSTTSTQSVNKSVVISTSSSVVTNKNISLPSNQSVFYQAPFFTTWFCSLGTILFLPLYLVTLLLSGTKASKIRSTLKESIHGFRDRGLTFGKFLGRCILFSLLWVLTNYLYIHSLRHLGCTEVMSLFATNVSFIYLLSWVVLHEQFVGIRIVAVILSNTGIALLAYMDGVAQTRTLGGVVLAAAAAAGSATYKVLFKRAIGDVSFCQVAIFFTMIGICSTCLLWPLILTFYFSGLEIIPWRTMPWPSLLAALSLSLGANLLANFGVAVTYETFITLGLILAVPACAVVDVMLYGAKFEGMKLAGIVILACGFIIVLFPENWPDAIQHIVSSLRRRHQREQHGNKKGPPDLRTGHIGSRLRSPSGRVR